MTLKAKALVGSLLVLLCGSVIFAAHYEKASITDKSGDGSYLKLDDGTEWIVDSGDRVDSELWLVADDVIYSTDSETCAHAQIINTDENGESVCASPVK